MPAKPGAATALCYKCLEMECSDNLNIKLNSSLKLRLFADRFLNLWLLGLNIYTDLIKMSCRFFMILLAFFGFIKRCRPFYKNKSANA
jgi:hypothetical protein